MPQLDVSWVTADPMLADIFSVTRRLDTIDANGRTTPTPDQVFLAQVGVVTQQDPAELMRRDDMQNVPRNIFIAARFAFRDASTGYQPDQITWPVNADGSPATGATVYTVKQAYPYSRYGQGMYECVATSMNAIDPPQ